MGDDREPWLGELLDAAAAEYAPDTERMRALVAARIAEQQDEERVTTASARSLRGKARRRGRLGLLGRLGLAGLPAGVALAMIGTTAAALAVGATATIAVSSQHDHPRSVTVSAPGSTSGGSAPEQSGTDTDSPSASPAATGSQSQPPAAATAGSTHPGASSSTSASATSSAPATDTAASALVGAAAAIDSGSNANWAQLDLNVTVKQSLTALDVTVKVSNCTGLAETGAWDSGATGQFTETTSKDSDGSITYEFQLTPGHEVSTGTVTFAVQFNHASTGWYAADDTFYASARTATSTSASSAHGAY